MLSEKVAIVDAKKTFHVSEKDQKVLGLEISYAKSAPPIGEPNAALTPDAIPTAINLRFSASFLKYFVIPRGKYGMAQPIIAPI